MESGFLTFLLVSSFAVYSSQIGDTDWDDVVVAKKGTSTTLPCIDATVKGAVSINWMVKSRAADEWMLVLLANEKGEFAGVATKASIRLTDPKFQDTGVFSLFFIPKIEDEGLYTCLIKQEERKLKERIILLAILTVIVAPAAPIPRHSTLRLIASVKSEFAKTEIIWSAPGGVSMKSEKQPKTTTVAKLPQVQPSDGGAYVCMVHVYNSSKPLFAFNVDVSVDADKVASFTNITHAPMISTATKAQTSCIVTCPNVQGDYVLLFWQPPDTTNQKNMKQVYQYDRWRDSTTLTERSKRLQLAGPPYNAEAGSFSFLLTPLLEDSGLYICKVLLNHNAFNQSTLLTVMKVTTRDFPSKLELGCRYKEWSQVRSAKWKYQNKSRKLEMSTSLGSITTTLPLPITSDTAGNYTCTLQLKNGQTVWATVILPREGNVTVTTPTLPPSLSALLLLVPLVAAAVGVLLWRQQHISDRGIEQSLSVPSCEAENIYEDPEDIRQALPQGSVYMDLKPRGEDDVYKELERSEQCQS